MGKETLTFPFAADCDGITTSKVVDVKFKVSATVKYHLWNYTSVVCKKI